MSLRVNGASPVQFPLQNVQTPYLEVGILSYHGSLASSEHDALL